MKAEHLNCFLEAAVDVLEKMLEADVTAGTIRRDEKVKFSGSFGTSIGIEGDLNGALIFLFPNDLAKEMTKKMFLENDLKVNSDHINEALCELCNIIAGNATGNLLDATLKCDLTPPFVTTGDEVHIYMPGVDSAIHIPLNTKIGLIDMYILLQDVRI